jgi:hypothetical protein
MFSILPLLLMNAGCGTYYAQVYIRTVGEAPAHSTILADLTYADTGQAIGPAPATIYLKGSSGRERRTLAIIATDVCENTVWKLAVVDKWAKTIAEAGAAWRTNAVTIEMNPPSCDQH